MRITRCNAQPTSWCEKRLRHRPPSESLGQPGGLGHDGHSASLQGQGLRGGPLSSRPLVHQGTEQFVLGLNGSKDRRVFHSMRVTTETTMSNLFPDGA